MAGMGFRALDYAYGLQSSHGLPSEFTGILHVKYGLVRKTLPDERERNKRILMKMIDKT